MFTASSVNLNLSVYLQQQITAALFKAIKVDSGPVTAGGSGSSFF